jgi:hypothetical protein
MDLFPNHTGWTEQVHKVRQETQHSKGGVEFFQTGNILAQKTHDAHGGAHMERQFFNINLALGQGHTEKVQNVQHKSQIDKELIYFFSAVIILISEQPQHHRSRHKGKAYEKVMPKTKQCKNLATGLIG